ncbi:MAG: hypothetical protein LUF87_02105 [Alistipes sp.]|nr:hypothetical protein [Alistipes sp.]
MTKRLLEITSRDEWEIAVVFANTGKEREETLQFISDCDNYFGFNTAWVEAVINPQAGKGTRHKIVNYDTAYRNGEPFEQMIRKYGLPNIRCKQCTRELKVNAIRSYAKYTLGWKKFYTAIGIRADEAQRISSKRDELLYLYPMVHDFPTIRQDVNIFWSVQPFTLNLKSYQGNCDLCFEKSERKLITLCHEKPHMANWWLEMERRYSHYISPGKTKQLELPLMFFRQKRSIAYFLAKAERGDFIPAADESKILSHTRSL